MSPDRGALSTLSTNQPLDRLSSAANGLYPIFHSSPTAKSEQGSPASRPRWAARTSPEGKSVPADEPAPAKRARVSLGQSPSVVRRESIADYFAPRTPLRQGIVSVGLVKETALDPVKSSPNLWRRQRRRLGQTSYGDLAIRRQRPSFLSSLSHSETENPLMPPSTVALPSVHSAVGDREFDPALVVAFNNTAKVLTADEALATGKRRLLAIGGEEGAIRVLDVDQPSQNGVMDHWWRAHNNGIFDLKWTRDDSRLLSASADQTIRIHDFNNGGPQVVASLVGHTSTIKSIAFLDTSRTNDTPHSSNIIVSGGRDGNIHIYDTRCRGSAAKGLDMPSGRTRRNVLGNEPASTGIEPALTLRQPHNLSSGRRTGGDSRSVSRTITSLVALQTMPGVIASGGSFDGVVKLWDVRVPAPSASQRMKATAVGDLSDPTICGLNPSRRPRSVNALCEDPRTGDLYALCGDSQIHVLRPSAVNAGNPYEAILPYKYAHPDLLARSFYIRMSLSSDGRYLACGSSHAGVMTWDTQHSSQTPSVRASRLGLPSASPSATAEVIAVDWGKDMLSASSDDGFTRIWRSGEGRASNLGLV